VSHGGHFFGASHTLTRFRDCFYRPILATTSNFERWTRDGALEMTERADILWRAALESYEPPPIDDGIRAELHEYAARRRRERGDVVGMSFDSFKVESARTRTGKHRRAGISRRDGRPPCVRRAAAAMAARCGSARSHARSAC